MKTMYKHYANLAKYNDTKKLFCIFYFLMQKGFFIDINYYLCIIIHAINLTPRNIM